MQENKSLIDEVTPLAFYLSQNYPNPFRERTIIKFCIPYQAKVKLSVFNSNGELIKKLVDGVKGAGTYEVDFELPSTSNSLVDTTYFYHLEAGDFSNLKKMILLR